MTRNTTSNKPVRYPAGLKRQYRSSESRKQKNHSKANMGKMFESYILQANELYVHRNRAVVFKQNPEITVTSMKENKITGGFWKEKGAPDFIGATNGRMFIFDCKETNEPTNFPLKNVKAHQVLDLERTAYQGAFGFLLIYFVKHHAVYLLTYEQLKDWWKGYTGDGRKSIPYDWIMLNCELVTPGGGLALDYLPVVQKFFTRKTTNSDMNDD